MAWRGPEFPGDFPSLGWAIIDGLQSNLSMGGKPLVMSERQVRFTVVAFKLVDDPETGWRRQYSQAAAHWAKGTGKTPLLAMFGAADLFLPTLFDGDWDDDGEPVGVWNSQALVHVIANSEDQVKGTLWRDLRLMLRDSKWNEQGLVEVGRTAIERNDGAQGAYFVSTSAKSIEGLKTTTGLAEETQYFTPGSGGMAAADIVQDNTTKTNGLFVEASNKPLLGLGSFGERTMELAAEEDAEAEADPEFIRSLFYSSYGTVPPEDPNFNPKDPKNSEIVLDAIEEACGPALISNGGWLDKNAQYRRARSAPRLEYMRKFLNWSIKGEGRLVGPDDWVRLLCESCSIEEGAPVVLAFDGSKSHDSTALSRWSIEDVPHWERVQVWQRPKGAGLDWRVPRGEVRAAVRSELDNYDVRLFVADPAMGWESQCDDWADELGERAITGRSDPGGRLMKVWVNNQARLWEQMVNTFEAAVKDREDDVMFTHSDDDVLERHVLNMVKARKRGFATVTTPGDGLAQRIDAGVTGILGYWGAKWLQRQGYDKAGASIDWASELVESGGSSGAGSVLDALLT